MSEPESIGNDRVVLVEGPSHCARCGGEHTMQVYYPLTVPLSRKGFVTHTHFAVCPTTGEPSMIIEPRDGVPGIADSFSTGHSADLAEFDNLVEEMRTKMETGE